MRTRRMPARFHFTPEGRLIFERNGVNYRLIR
jgi:hypothetical protein